MLNYCVCPAKPAVDRSPGHTPFFLRARGGLTLASQSTRYSVHFGRLLFRPPHPPCPSYGPDYLSCTAVHMAWLTHVLTLVISIVLGRQKRPQEFVRAQMITTIYLSIFAVVTAAFESTASLRWFHVVVWSFPAFFSKGAEG